MLIVVLEVNPANNDAKMALAEIFDELGDEESSLKLLKEVGLASKLGTNKPQDSESDYEDDGRDDEGEEFQGDGSMPALISSKRRSEGQRCDPILKRANEVRLEKQNVQMLAKLSAMYPKTEISNISRVEYVRLARDLLSRFQNTKEYYPVLSTFNPGGTIKRIFWVQNQTSN